jgi:hypothetical protein
LIPDHEVDFSGRQRLDRAFGELAHAVFPIDDLLPDRPAARPSVSTMSARRKEVRRSRAQGRMPRLLTKVNNISCLAYFCAIARRGS